MKTCKNCSSTDLVARGASGFRNVCRVCWAKAQREAWAKNRTKGRAALKRAYAKHAPKRRSESAKYKQQHREYYALAEWFRKKGIRVSHIAPSDITALVEMKQALKQAKAQTQLPTQSPMPDQTDCASATRLDCSTNAQAY